VKNSAQFMIASRCDMCKRAFNDLLFWEKLAPSRTPSSPPPAAGTRMIVCSADLFPSSANFFLLGRFISLFGRLGNLV
jgi:hypothetical protein